MWGLHYKSKGRNVGLASIVEIELEMAGVPDGSGMLECQNARGCTAHSLPAVEWESVLRRRIRSSSLAAALDWLTRDKTPLACLTQGLSESCLATAYHTPDPVILTIITCRYQAAHCRCPADPRQGPVLVLCLFTGHRKGKCSRSSSLDASNTTSASSVPTSRN